MVAVRPSYIQDARFLKVKLHPFLTENTHFQLKTQPINLFCCSLISEPYEFT